MLMQDSDDIGKKTHTMLFVSKEKISCAQQGINDTLGEQIL